MNLDRREVLGMMSMAAVAGLAGVAHAQPGAEGAKAPERFLDWKPAGDARVAFGFGGNSLVLRRGDAVLLVDCKNSPYGPVLRREAALEAGGPVTMVLNTHHHADHTGGNHAMAGLPLIAHEKAIPRVSAQLNRYISQLKEAVSQLADKKGPLADQVRAETKATYAQVTKLAAADFTPRTGIADGHELDVGGTKIILRQFGPGHTDNDLVVNIPDLHVVHTGDLVFHGRHPFVDRSSGATTTGWQESLRRVLTLCDASTVVVPGHGPLGTRDAIQAQIDYFDRIRAHVQGMVKTGTTRQAVAESKPAGLERYEGSPAIALVAVFEELTGVAPG